MGKGENSLKPDICLKEFWRDKERFADLFNSRFFGGKQVIVPDRLMDADTDVSSTVLSKYYKESVNRHRDVCKLYDGMNLRINFGIENQLSVHFAMPLRNRIYDDMMYAAQVKEIAKKRRGKTKGERLSSAEFLSGLKKTDRLMPCLTVTIYYGEDVWDGSLALSDMVDIPDGIRPLFQDYSMHFISARDDDGTAYSNEEVRNLFCVLSLLYQDRTDELMDLDIRVCEDTYHVLQSLPGTSGCLRDMEPDSKGGISVCAALETIKETGRLEGREAGREEGRIEGRIEMLIELIKDQLLTSAEAARRVGLSEKDFIRKYL